MDATVRTRTCGATGRAWICALAAVGVLSWAPAVAAHTFKGQVLGAGAPIANSTVTLWAATAGAPKQLAQARTGADGRFTLNPASAPAKDASLYLVARGGQPTARQGQRQQPRHRADDGARQHAAGRGHDQRDDDRRVGVDAQPVHRRHRDQGPAAATRRSPPATCRASSISPPAAGGRPSRIRSTAARRPRWPTSRHWPTCSRDASLG